MVLLAPNQIWNHGLERMLVLMERRLVSKLVREYQSGVGRIYGSALVVIVRFVLLSCIHETV